MPNYFSDNKDIVFHFEHRGLDELASIMEDGFVHADTFPHAPVDADDALDNYRRVLEELGSLSGEFICERTESIDQIGNALMNDGSVQRPPGMDENLRRLAQAQVMGFTLPHQYGGLNFPNLIYTMAIEIVSRADAALMNIFGLQGIAETINAFADEQMKAEYLPQFSDGVATGAMVLTEPDAGSDLQAVKTRAYQDDNGNWYINGVKRFITNGCGEVLLVLARSEPDRSGGLGLSLFLCERGPTVKVRRLEDKLGIHGSPTCEIFFDDTPAKLIGERQRGLVTYVMSLMNGARIGIAAQSLGIAEACYEVAREYAHSRQQFGMPIEQLPAVRDLLTDMRMDIEVARTLTYHASRCVDLEYGALRKLESGSVTDKDQIKQLKEVSRTYKRVNGMLTPMCKYYSSEMCNRVAYNAIQVLGGSGYMRDYPVERLYRDARITTIYEGTSQLQVVAAVRGVTGGTAVKILKDLAGRTYDDSVKDLQEKLVASISRLEEAIAFVKEQSGTEYMDLYGRKLVDMAIDLLVGFWFLADAPHSDRKLALARHFVAQATPRANMLADQITSGDVATMKDFDLIAGPPTVEAV